MYYSELVSRTCMPPLELLDISVISEREDNSTNTEAGSTFG